MTADEIIAALGMRPHPEGGYYCETFRDPQLLPNGRPVGTAIYYLLKAAQRSDWHRVDAAEIWHWYGGAPLRLAIAAHDDAPIEHHTLGGALGSGERPQYAVPASAWQSAETLGAFSFVGCTVAPGFQFSRYELAPPGWRPGRSA